MRRAGRIFALCGVLAAVGISAGMADARQMANARPWSVSVRTRYLPATDGLAVAATLTASLAGRRLGFGSVAVSGQTIAGISFDPLDLTQVTGAYAYDRPAAGWSSTSSGARLTAPNGDRLGSLAVSDDTVVIGDGSLGDAGPITAYVFARPASGWVGDLLPAATLSAPVNGSGTRGAPLVAVSGHSVFTSDGNAVFVFNEPVTGWTGTLRPDAMLAASTGETLGAIAVSGDTLVAMSDSHVFVFSEPPTGWSGTLHQTATLSMPIATQDPSIALSGHTIIAGGGVDPHDTAGAYVFSAPAGGWSSRRTRLVARLSYPNAVYDIGPLVVASGKTVGLVTALPTDHECPCGISLYALSAVGGQWFSRTIGPSAGLDNGGPPPIGLADQTLAAGTGDGIHVYIVRRPSQPSTLRLTDLGARPRLILSAGRRQTDSKLTRLTITLPDGLRFDRRRGRAIAISAAARSQITPERLVVTLDRPTARVRVSIADGALTETQSLRKTLNRLARRPRQRKHAPMLRIATQLYDQNRASAVIETDLTIR